MGCQEDTDEELSLLEVEGGQRVHLRRMLKNEYYGRTKCFLRRL